MTGGLGLPVLVSRVLGALTDEAERGREERGVPSLAVWSNVLRGVDEAGTDLGLPAVTRISKRLAVSAVTGCRRVGWLTAEKGKRGRDLSLTPSGRAAEVFWVDRLAALDAGWAGSPLRSALESLVARFPLEHPWFPASYGGADPSAVGGSFVAADPSGDVPAHGQDWKPVRRSDGDTVSAVPLPGLLSQVLLAFSIDYEGRPRWPLASTTLVVRHLSAEPAPLADVPAAYGIAGNGKSLLERHGVAVVEPGPSGKTVRLTNRGWMIASTHDAAVREVEAGWRDRFGGEVVDGLRAALEDHPASKDDSWPDHVTFPLHHGL